MNYYKEIKKLKERVDGLERNVITLNDDGLLVFAKQEEPKKETPKFKVGDDVIICSKYDSDNNKKGFIVSNNCFPMCYDVSIDGELKHFREHDLMKTEERFTEDEKAILRNLPENFNYIARDRDSSLLIFASKPFKKEYYWSNGYGSINMSMYNHLFQSIQWEDKEPCEFRKYI